MIQSLPLSLFALAKSFLWALFRDRFCETSPKDFGWDKSIWRVRLIIRGNSGELVTPTRHASK